MKIFQLATVALLAFLFTSCASTDGVQKNAWGFNNNPVRITTQNIEEEEVEENQLRFNQRLEQDYWQNPLTLSRFDNVYSTSMMFTAPPSFVPVMVPWWESSWYWHYNPNRHFMFQCNPMTVFWDWYSPFYNTNPFWGGSFYPTRFAWGGFTTYQPPITRTIVDSERSQQVRDFGPSRNVGTPTNTTRQAAPTNDGWNNRSQNYRPPSTTSSPTRTQQNPSNDSWNTRRTTTPSTPSTSNPKRTFTREQAAPQPSRNATSSPSRMTTSPSSNTRSTSTPKSTPPSTGRRQGR